MFEHKDKYWGTEQIFTKSQKHSETQSPKDSRGRCPLQLIFQHPTHHQENVSDLVRYQNRARVNRAAAHIYSTLDVGRVRQKS